MQSGMPPYVYAIIGGVVLIMVIAMVFGMKKSFARARNAGGDMMSGLSRLGLAVTRQEGAKTWLEGAYRGRKVAMQIDGTAVQKVGKSAMMGSLMAGAKGLAGVGGLGFGGDDEASIGKSKKLQNRLQNAAMIQRWAVILPLDSPVKVEVRRDDDAGGESFGDGLYGTFDEPARAGLTNPQVTAALSAADFDIINIEGKKVTCSWATPMKEYQKFAASSDAFAAVSQRALDALCTMCDGLYGPAA